MRISNAPLTCLVWAILFIIMCGILSFGSWNTDLRTDGPTIALETSATMRQRFAGDTVVTRLAKGDSLRVLAVNRTSYGQAWLVEAPSDAVGWVDASDLKGIPQVLTDGKDKGDTVTVEAKWLGAHIYWYVYTDKEGEKKERSTKDFVPAMEGLSDYYYDDGAISGICTLKKFERKTVGKTLDVVNKEFGQPVLFNSGPNGMRAQYAWKVFDPETGQMGKANVTFGADSLAEAVEFALPTKRAAGWLKKMPMAAQIIDMPVTSWLIRSSRYNIIDDTQASGTKKVLLITFVIVLIICSGVWLFCTQSIPTLFMGWLMKFPPVYAPLSDGVLRALLFAVSLVTCYVWMVMMMAWGMFPFWSIVIVIVSWYTFSLASSPLCTAPHCRCPKCRNLYTISYDHKVLDHTEIKKGRDIKRGQLLGSRTEKWKTWTRVTTIKGGSTTYYDKDFETHHRDYNTYEFTGYDVTWRVEYYIQYYKCSKCGHIEELPTERWVEIDRKKTDVYAAEIAGSDY